MESFLIWLLAALAILDIAFTTKILRLGGTELWPPMVWAQATFSNGWGAIKYGLTVGAALLWGDQPLLLVVAIVIMTYVVWRNYKILKSMKHQETK